MKKKLIFAGAVVLMVAAAVTGFTTSSWSNAADLLDANVEALTESEDGGGYNNARSQYCAFPTGATGCVSAMFRHCDLTIFCAQ